ncbi:hypothetical protein [Yoonia sp.]|uniref:hypothetical protein n=1 Tax=Yoonia sp. TaxID=2212373 RepID=UPI0025E69F01|nr:hypothetical protein [Yoonia sp.]
MIALAITGLAACATGSEPNRGVGFDTYAMYELERAEREAALSSGRSSGIVPPAQVTVMPSPQAPQGIPSSALAAAGIGQAAGTTPSAVNTAADPGRVGGVDASPTNAPPIITNNPRISDEQSFDAVAERETIESDAQRRAAQAAAREQIAPSAVPERPGSTGPNIVEYAINAPNVKGQAWYSRSLLTTQARFIRNCAAYANADEAQRDFLARGGPERDRLGLDPDGDGFACGWDPAPFKRAAGN